MAQRTLTERLMASPAAVNRMAALHMSGGDHTGKEELLWEQNGRFHDLGQRPTGEQLSGGLTAHAQLYDGMRKLAAMERGSPEYKAYKPQVKKLWRKTHAEAHRGRMNMRFNASLKRAREKCSSNDGGETWQSFS